MAATASASCTHRRVRKSFHAERSVCCSAWSDAEGKGPPPNPRKRPTQATRQTRRLGGSPSASNDQLILREQRTFVISPRKPNLRCQRHSVPMLSSVMINRPRSRLRSWSLFSIEKGCRPVGSSLIFTTSSSLAICVKSFESMTCLPSMT
jgi:hypothetical protein